MFEGRRLLVATKHKKEEVIAPLFFNELGLSSFVLDDFDTDAFGTFTGEIEREGGPLDALRKKAYAAMSMAEVDLVVASEGSFGPHPSLYFVPAADEMLLFVDKKNDLEVLAREVTTETNFNSAEIKSEEELLDFAQKALFPSHALILSDAHASNSQYFKGITSKEELLKIFNDLRSSNDNILVQTDMRALYNPTRMKTIARACHKLIRNIVSQCPSCVTPGYNVTDVLDGLPCSLCGRPTNSTLAHQYVCRRCGYKELRYYPNLKLEEDPTFCDYCNP
ncbi:MAG: hypothetical protein RLZZ390_1141 [Bacteroidota bacterium]|jgi:rRNA maturation endonuclease Nob1